MVTEFDGDQSTKGINLIDNIKRAISISSPTHPNNLEAKDHTHDEAAVETHHTHLWRPQKKNPRLPIEWWNIPN